MGHCTMIDSNRTNADLVKGMLNKAQSLLDGLKARLGFAEICKK
jgi:hypothetical protein